MYWTCRFLEFCLVQFRHTELMLDMHSWKFLLLQEGCKSHIAQVILGFPLVSGHATEHVRDTDLQLDFQ